MNYEELKTVTLEWAKNRGIMDKATVLKQLGKTQEELTETIKAVEEYDIAETMDGFGDMLVTIVIAAELANVDLLACWEMAYNVIAKRTGKMVDGVFVKDSK